MEGPINISDFALLEKLHLCDNKLTKLNITNCPKIKLISCNSNLLIDANFLSALDPKKLTNLYLENNNISEQDLNCFEKFTNLVTLLIGNSDENKIRKNAYNRFTGSLESLKNLTNLERLSIKNTDIDSGLEYLPSAVKEFHCFADHRRESKVKKIEEELKPFLISGFHGTYNFNDWKKNKEIKISSLSEQEQNYKLNVCKSNGKKRKFPQEYQEVLEINDQGKEPSWDIPKQKNESNNSRVKPKKIFIGSQKNWQNISLDFKDSPELVREWQKKGFKYEECKEWIDIGLRVTDANFCVWLRDIKKVCADQLLNNSDAKNWSNEFQQWVSELAKKTNDFEKEYQQFQQTEVNFYKKIN